MHKEEFVHLHVHTEYSKDGMCRIPDLVGRVSELGMPGVAITDHGNMSGAVELYKSAVEAEIKPIVGCEVYTCPDMKRKEGRDTSHLVLLAMDEVGYHNLMKIVTAGYLEGFYYRPRVDLDFVSQHSDGLIAMTACIAGRVPWGIIAGDEVEAKSELVGLKDIFLGNLYIEVQDHNLPDQRKVNPTLLKFGRELDIPVVATNDCHYVYAEDYFAHDVLLCIQTKKKLMDKDRLRLNGDYYLKTAEQMAELFPLEYLTRTLEVAEKCDLELDLSTNYMPDFHTPDGSSPDDYLWTEAQKGIQQRFGGKLDAERQKRLATEYEVIKNMGFSGYFLIIADMVRWAREQGIRVGPGRGSVGASLVSYLLHITDVDPVEHDLLFARFLNEGRVSQPDIDVDFAHDRRGEVIEYLGRKYGSAASIVTFNRFRPRSVLRAVGKALAVSSATIDRMAKSIPTDSDETLVELQKRVPELRHIDPRVMDAGTRLHGVVSYMGRHPGGIVVSSEPLVEHIPLLISKGDVLTQYDKDSLEDAGVLKIDALGTKFLTAVATTLALIEHKHGVRIESFPEDDHETYDLICSGRVSGIFQLGQGCGRELVERIQPRDFNDIIHLISIGRPGVMASDLADGYFKAKIMGEARYLHPSLEPILSETRGVILYQEQIMQIASAIAGFTWSKSDKLRKAIAKKQMELMESLEAEFLAGCVSHGVPRDVAEKLWAQIHHFGGYGFNKAHAVGYALLTYQTAYLKAHYPLEYLAGSISARKDDEEERNQAVIEARQSGIEIHSPDINISTGECAIVGGSIFLPLTMVKQVGAVAYQAIVAERARGLFRSYDDFCYRVGGRKVNKKVRESLACAGAFDKLEDRCGLLRRLLDVEGLEPVALELDTLGVYLSPALLGASWYKFGAIHVNETAALPTQSEFMTIGIVDGLYEHWDRNGNLMAFATLDDGTGQLESVIFASVYKCPIVVGNIVRITGRLDDHEPPKAIVIDYGVL